MAEKDAVVCPVTGQPLTTSGLTQRLRWPVCQHELSVEGAATMRTQSNPRCPHRACGMALPRGTTLSDLHTSSPSGGQLDAYPAVLAKPNSFKSRTGMSVLAHEDRYLCEKREQDQMWAEKKVVDPQRRYKAGVNYVLPYNFVKEDREKHRQTLEAGGQLPPGIVHQLVVGDLLVAPSKIALKQPLSEGFRRFQLDVFYRAALLLDAPVSISTIFVPIGYQVENGEAATCPPEVHKIVKSVCGDAVSKENCIKLQDVLAIRDTDEMKAVCRLIRRSVEDVICGAFGEAIQFQARNDVRFYEGLNGVRADGRNGQMYVCFTIAGKEASLRRVRLQHLRGMDGVREAYSVRLRRGGMAKGPIAQFDHRLAKLQDEGMKKLAKLLYGAERDDAWVDVLLTDTEDHPHPPLDSDDEETGWRIYDPDEGLESDEEDS